MFADILAQKDVEDETEPVHEFVLEGAASAYFDNVVVTSGGQTLFAEDFEDVNLDDWSVTSIPQNIRRVVEVGEGKAIVHSTGL